MKTITISDETAAFLYELTTRLENGDNRGTADPYYFTVRKFIDVGVPEGCGNETHYFDNYDVENYTEEKAKQRAIELELEFDDYIEKRCHKYDVKEEEQYENFFFTLDGYNEHVRLNGHNIARVCNKYDSYVDHAYRNPEIAGVLKAIKEIGCALKQEKLEPTFTKTIIDDFVTTYINKNFDFEGIERTTMVNFLLWLRQQLK